MNYVMTGCVRRWVMLTLAAFSALSTSAASGTTIRIRPGDTAFAEARARLREMSEEVRKKGVEIILRPGVYRFDEPFLLEDCDSGTKESPIVWKAEKPGSVIFTSQAEIPVAGFKPWKDGILVAPIPEEADLSQMTSGALTHNEMTSLGIPDLIVDGKFMRPATWPNEGWAEIARFIKEGWISSDGNVAVETDRPYEGGIFGYTEDRPSRWLEEKDYWLEGYWCFDWAFSCIPVKTIDTVNKTIELAQPHAYGVRQGNPSRRRWRARHLKCELDAPGEYYVDAKASRLYLVPPAGFDAKLSKVTISGTLEELVILDGVSNVTFQDIIFEGGWKQMLKLKNCHRVKVKDCTFRLGHHNGVGLYGCSYCRVMGCDFFDMGAGGLFLGKDDIKTLKGARNLVQDCLFRRCSEKRLTYAPAINASECVGSIVRHCEITDQPHIGVVFNANDSIWEYNVLSNVCYAADDASGYYCGRRPQCRGNEIRHSLFKDIRSRLGKAGMCGIYYDDGQGGDYIHHNIFVNAGRCSVRPDGTPSYAGAMYTNSGFSNRCENCIFVDCMQALGCHHPSKAQWEKEIKKGVESDGNYWSLTADYGRLDFFKNELYLTKYPMLRSWLTGYFEPETRVNSSKNIVCVDCEFTHNPKHGGWIVDRTLIKYTGRDPGFVDRKKGNYDLKWNSEVYKKLPGFTRIEWDKMGLLRKR